MAAMALPSVVPFLLIGHLTWHKFKNIVRTTVEKMSFNLTTSELAPTTFDHVRTIFFNFLHRNFKYVRTRSKLLRNFF